ncbi:CPW-WPC family protein, putative [Plasmodium malariae]|uniref:CPW-WPC family protein, putative n=1 Tax=Plasmodium malariae TaxID=5858 RepID=A0A1C3L376_PLAMA|nr:CPW-WPC family protein, putative [Plasmodium malariae]
MPSKFIYLFLSSVTICFNCFNDSSFFFTYALNKGKNKASNFLNVSNDNIQYDDISSFSEELINAFSLRLKRVPELVLREKVAIQLAKAADNLNLPNPNEEVCEINYAELCPEGWSNFGDGESCLSPINYTGGCDKKVSFKNYTAINKYVFSIKCSTSWPCINKCTQNYSEECPENWILINKNICKAPKNYKGKCIKEKMFSKFSESEKKIWAEKCDVNWPCYEKTYNLKVVCPIDWKIHPNNKSCIAPTSYIGPCMSIMYLHNLKDNEKLSLIKKCNIEWPIHEKKEVDLSSLCPIGWNITHVDNITCSAPSSYVGPCEKIISFENFSKEEKYEFSQKCDIHWPLLDQKLQNFNLPCPYNWNLLDEKNNICISPIEYQGPCENIFSFKNYNNENIDKATDVDTDDNTVEAANNRNDVKNWYNNYKVENANLAYSGVCLKKNYMECPVGWTRINDKQCLASKSYAGRVRKCGSILNLGEVVKNMYDVTHDMSFVTADIEKRKKIEKDCNVQFPCIECERDYIRINCPLGWKEMNDGICEAPEDYPLYLKELCGNVVNFKYASANFKRKWSFLCKADWPCFSVCEKNYAHPCPLGYKLINERTDKYYKDHIYVCANENWKDYDQKSNLRQRNICHVIEVYNSIILKKEIEKKCKVIWPCLNICEENFYQSCPYNWLLKDNKCIAPYYYKPPKGCKNSLEIFTFSTFDKYLFSNKCFAPWPCKNSCQQDWTSPCPDGWTRLKAAEKKSKSKYNADSKYNEGSKHNDQGDDKIYDDQSENKKYKGHSDDNKYRGHSDDNKYRGHSDDNKYRGHSDDKKYRGHSDDKKYRGHSDDKKYGHNDDKYDQSEDNKYKDHSDDKKYGHNDDKYDQSEDNKYKDHRDDNKYNYHDDEKMNSSYFCKPPKTYKGACSEEYYNLADFTFSQKQDFSYRCSAKWPCGATLHHSENWQKENFYHDINFEKLKTIRFYDTFYSSQYSKYQTPFF